MTSDSLLGYLAWRFPGATEDIATEALCYILCKQEGARTALADLLRSGGADPEPMDSFETQGVYQRTKKPDLVAFNDGREVLLVESKFWATLTPNQPNGYLELMMKDKDLRDAKNLLFIAPEARQDELWEELREQAADKFQFTRERAADGVRSAAVGNGGHRLMLTSWDTLLDRLERSGTDTDGDRRQLRGLCTPACDYTPLPSGEAEKLKKVGHYKDFLVDAVALAECRGITNTKGFGVGGDGEFGKFFRFVNAAEEELGAAWVGFSFDRNGDPFFLWFIDNQTGFKAKPGRTEEIHPQISAELDKHGHISIPIDATAGYAYVREQVVGKLKEIRDRITVPERGA